ncbi:serine/threonine-protein kinase RsbW [Stackebrandtia albiflava]|uniref:Serine/threonine-protein kinase RsbW n=1 Tax=Stackebrandtia albiflava TaxID=406432 RepID=A0A562V5E7_9ACTN|nr:anti-sigma regulatory factor [Stackebrandtia albiflava]TWJ13042.1 serine/threonine-protein kinase RsbW [Stackebrandtia albiflava]
MSHAVEGDVLLLDIPAGTGFLPVLRTATAGLATRLGFGLDAIEDLRVAVDEAAGLMLAAAPGEQTVLRCRFDVTEADLLITIGATGIRPLPDRQSFDWRVLDALAGSVVTEVGDGVTTMRLTQRLPSDTD